MDIDQDALKERLEESADLHRDAMARTAVGLDDLVELGHESRAAGDEHEPRSWSPAPTVAGAGVFAAGVAGAVLALSSAAGASTSADVQMLQTAQSIETLAIATYTVALTLPFIGGASANGVVKAFVTETRTQHRDHLAAFGSAVKALGGKSQSAADPVLAGVVNKAKPGLTSAAKVVALALELEDGAAQTYVANTSALGDKSARAVMASIMGVEAQHVAVLRAVGALLAAGDASLIALPPKPLTSLPAAAGSVGFPNAYYLTSAARPKSEGALTK